MKTNYKKIIRNLFIACISLLIVNESGAQPTNKINYQAVARDANGDPLQNQNVAIRISILNGSGGPSFYTETFNLNTNNFGLFTLQIGGGTPVSGNYNTINWSAGNQWLKVEMDPAGGSSYVNMGESQLLSVPYSLYAASSGQWSSNGNDILNSNSGNVGIGTNVPASKLHVYTAFDGDGIYMQPVTVGHGLGVLLFNTVDLVATLGAAGTAGDWISTSVANDVILKNSRPNSLIFGTNNAEQMRIDSSGNVGIGTTNPLAKLHLVSSGNQAMIINGAPSMYAGLYEGGTYRGYIGSYAGSAEDVDFGTGTGNATGSVHLTIEGNPALTVAASGDVGIGTTSPTRPLQVVTAGLDIAEFKSTGGSDARILFSTNAGVKGTLGWTPFNNTIALSSYGADDVSIGVSNLTVEAIRIDAPTGNVGIGTTAPASRLHISYPTGVGNGFTMNNNIDTDEWEMYVFSSNDLNLYFNGVAGLRGSFDDVTGNYTAISDKRLKRDIISSPDILGKIKQLQLKEYCFVHDAREERYLGFLAQDVMEVFPQLVKYQDESDVYTMDYSGFGPIAIKAIQEQQKMIEALKAEIESLKFTLAEKK